MKISLQKFLEALKLKWNRNYGYWSTALTQYFLDILLLALQDFVLGTTLHIGLRLILKRD